MTHYQKFSPLRAGVYKRLLTKRLEIGVVTLTMTLIVITCILSIMLLLHSNHVATKGYDLRELRQQKEDLVLYNQRLKALIAKKQSLQAIVSNDFIDVEFRPVQSFVIIETDTKLAIREEENDIQ